MSTQLNADLFKFPVSTKGRQRVFSEGLRDEETWLIELLANLFSLGFQTIQVITNLYAVEEPAIFEVASRGFLSPYHHYAIDSERPLMDCR